jgi:hypothetical protein
MQACHDGTCAWAWDIVLTAIDRTLSLKLNLQCVPMPVLRVIASRIIKNRY